MDREHTETGVQDEEQREETVTPSRINPREILEPVADEVAFVEPGEWVAEAVAPIDRSVMVALYLEGFRIGKIERLDYDGIRFEVIEEAGIEEDQRAHATELIEQFNEKHDVTVKNQALVLAEEMGEVANAVLEADGDKLFARQGGPDATGDEVADVLYTARSVALAAGVGDIDRRLLDVARENLDREGVDE